MDAQWLWEFSHHMMDDEAIFLQFVSGRFCVG